MNTRKLGFDGPSASMIGLGCMAMSGIYGPADRTESIATIHAAFDAGVTLLNTGDFYGIGHNEMLIGEAVRGPPRDAYQISVKFSTMRDINVRWVAIDGRLVAIKNFIAYKPQRLGLDYIDIYRFVRLNPAVRIEDTVGAMAELVQVDWIHHIGLSEVGTSTVRRAAAGHAISDLQIEYSIIARGIEETILPACRELGIGITAYGVRARRLISGYWNRDKSQTGDMRADAAFQSGNIDVNLHLVEAMRQVAEAEGVTVAQIAIAWVLAQGTDISLIGARRVVQLSEALAATSIVLSADNVRQIEAAVPKGAAAGARYPALQMQNLDSER